MSSTCNSVMRQPEQRCDTPKHWSQKNAADFIGDRSDKPEQALQGIPHLSPTRLSDRDQREDCRHKLRSKLEDKWLEI